jgi:tetratricopeptide (TPR) repeat protein
MGPGRLTLSARRAAAGLAAALCAAAGGSAALAEEAPDVQDWPAVITRLKQDAHRNPGEARHRQQLAIAHNNYGVQLSEQEQWTAAVQQFQEAIRLEPDNAQFSQSLSHVYLRLAHAAHDRREIQETVQLLEKAVAVNPSLAQAYALLGKIEYERQRLKEAKAAWERAIALDPAQADVAERLAQLAEELPVESKFERISQAYFELRYQEALDRPAGFDLRDALVEARREVGSDFAYWPKHKIVVLIYSAEQFRALRKESPEWLGGQFDGKIRVPLPGTQLNQAAVKGVLFHEYTHAVVYDLTRGTCPTWLNEGLAEYEGAKQHREPPLLLRQAHAAQRLIPWAELSDHISMSGARDDVGLAYQQSHSVIAYFVERYGFWRIRRILKAIAEGASWQDAMAAELRAKLPRLEQQWREWLPGFLRDS